VRWQEESESGEDHATYKTCFQKPVASYLENQLLPPEEELGADRSWLSKTEQIRGSPPTVSANVQCFAFVIGNMITMTSSKTHIRAMGRCCSISSSVIWEKRKKYISPLKFHGHFVGWVVGR